MRLQVPLFPGLAPHTPGETVKGVFARRRERRSELRSSGTAMRHGRCGYLSIRILICAIGMPDAAGTDRTACAIIGELYDVASREY